MEENKRRTGKFNIVDIIILVILLAGAAFLGMRFLGGGDEVIGSTTPIEYTVRVYAVDPGVCDTILAIQEKSGKSQLMASGNMVDGYVTDIKVEPHMNYEVNSDGLVVSSRETGDDARKDMTFTIQANVSSLVTCKVGTQEVRVGKNNHVVKTAEYELEGYDSTILTRITLE